tara:strand:+ start:411 stop:1292 length:882 start_codon:yes stop_codon:yes gene_type:complete
MSEFNPTEFSGNMEQNPLRKYFRQPKVYITLPSKGKFYPEGSIEITQNGEYPVFAMTAKDELTMKTPDALLNGAATVDVIKSCVPNITNPWSMPSIDLDAALIAIRIATYGDSMEITTKVPNTGDERKFDVDLRQLLNNLVTKEFDVNLDINDMKVLIRPLTYKEFTDASLKTFEEQRIFSLVNDDEMPDSEKLAKFNKSFRKLTDLTVSTLSKSIASISIGDTVVTNQVHIDDFIDNADKDFYTTIIEHLESQRSKFTLEPMKVNSSAEDVANGAPENWEVPITFDQSNFFA